VWSGRRPWARNRPVPLLGLVVDPSVPAVADARAPDESSMPSCPTARRGTVLGAVAMPLDGRTISSARTSSRKPSPGLPMVAPRMTTEEATPKTKGHARSASARCSKLRFAPRLEAVSLRCAESAAGPAVELDGPTVQPANGCRPPALRTDLRRDDLAHETPPLPVRGAEQGKGSPAVASSRTTPGTGDSLPAVGPVKSRPADLFQ
jgi:hypothetical protein